VGCGCRGRALAAALGEIGHAVRGTSRHPERLAEIEAAGAEAVEADPDRLGTLLPALEGVSVVCWPLGNADNSELHGPRLASLLERLIDTPVRGFVYEDGGGAEIVRNAGERWRIPIAVIGSSDWSTAAWVDAVARLT
jgi:uncharacterized protein YbjT (DUF2867 family)